MYRHLIPQSFFDENFKDKLSAPRMLYSYMLHEELEEAVTKALQFLEDRCRDERMAYEVEDDPAKLVDFMRRHLDPLNAKILRCQILKYEEQTIPLILKKLRTNGVDQFSEISARLFKEAKHNYTAELKALLNDIRNPYALAVICIALGFIGDEDIIPEMIQQHHNLKTRYPDKVYQDGPLMALCELRERFYK